VADSETKQMTSFMIEPSLLARTDEKATEMDRSRSWVIREAVRAYLGPTRSPAHRMAGGSRGYCADCPDHEACSTGWQCWMVKEVAETTGDLTTEPYEGTA
jgi:metal-responsive CopG/Arc/MetJ family transcriptional regulator